MKKLIFLFIISVKIIFAQGYNFIDSTSVNRILYYPSLNKYYPSYSLNYKKDKKVFPLIYNHGILIGGKIDNNLTVGGLFAGRYSFEPGGYNLPLNNISNRIFKLLKGFDNLSLDNDTKERLIKDFQDWPTEFGAPFVDINNNGTYDRGIDNVKLWGDEMFWYVSNLYSNYSESFYESSPMPIEIQTTVSSFNYGILKDVIFIRYKIINKGNKAITDAFIGHYVDVDILTVDNTLVGVDSSLNLAYGYSITEFDSIFNTIPQSIGCLLLQGTKIPGNSTDSASYDFNWLNNYSNMNLSSFTPYYRMEDRFFILTKEHFYNFLRGLKWNGEPFINPLTNSPTLFPLNGNPATGEGWFGGLNDSIINIYEFDYRFLINLGPFHFAPQDTQEVVYAFIVTEGETNLVAVNNLIEKAKAVKSFYNYYNTSFTSLKSFEAPIPEYYKLSQNYPNPFNPSTEIEFEIPMKGFVSLKIFNILGEEIAELINNDLDAGSYSISFNSNINGIKLPSGIYFYTLSVREYSKTKKMVLLK